MKLVQSLSEDLPLDDGPAGKHTGRRSGDGHNYNRLMVFQQKECSLVTKGSSPEFCCVGLRDPEIVPLEQTVGKDGFQLSQHVTEDKREFGQVSPERNKKRRRGSRINYSKKHMQILIKGLI